MTAKPTQVDLLDFARFSLLNGASRLITAFAGIPEGPMRESVIHMAETLAATYAGAPAHERMPDPINSIDAPPLKLPSRTGNAPKTTSPEMDVVKLRISGLSVVEIVAKTGIPKDTVYNALKAARAAGLTVPRGNTGVPLKGQGAAQGHWHTSLTGVSAQGLIQISKAAAQRGISPEAYLERRQIALKLAQEGASYETILDATGEKDAKIVSSWLSNARGAGISVPYVTFVRPDNAKTWAQPAAAEAPEPEPAVDVPQAPAGRVFPPTAELPFHVRKMIQRAADRRSLTLAAYEDLRESIVRLRMQGNGNQLIATMIGEPRFFVRDILDAAKARGVVFPEVETERSDAEVETLRKKMAGGG